MLVVTVMYPSQDGATFNHDYYLGTHVKLVDERWRSMGLKQVKLLRGVPGPDGTAPAFMMIAQLEFDSMAEFAAAAQQHGKEIFADIPNFTSVQPVVQFNEAVS